MTFREKLAKEHPEFVAVRYIGDCKYCPSDYGHETKSYCTVNCYACWDREMPTTPEEQAAQEEYDLAINAEIIRGYCIHECKSCPAVCPCQQMDGLAYPGLPYNAAKQRAMLDAFEAALPPLDEEDGGRPQAAPTEDKATVERDVRERLDYLFWEASGKLKAWYETRDREELERALWLLRWMTEIQEGEG